MVLLFLFFEEKNLIMKKGLSQLIAGILILILASAIGITYYTSKKDIQPLVTTTTTIMGATTTIVYVAPLTLKLFTDKSTYSQGNLVTIFGNVTDGNGDPIQGEFVSIEVKDPRENTYFLDIATTSDYGSFTSSFRLHSLATIATYNVYATCIEPKVVQTSFDVI